MGPSIDGPQPGQERSRLSLSYITLTEEERLAAEFRDVTDDQLRLLAQRSQSLDPIHEWLRRSDEKIKKLEKAFAAVLTTADKRTIGQYIDGASIEAQRMAALMQKLSQSSSQTRP